MNTIAVPLKRSFRNHIYLIKTTMHKLALAVLLTCLAVGSTPAINTSAASLTVNTNNDVYDLAVLCASAGIVHLPGSDGLTSLREAICASNNTAGGTHTINFSITSGKPVIALTSFLPAITHSVIIDGTTQPGYAGAPLVVLDGVSAGTGGNGLRINAGDSAIKGLVIQRFSGNGIGIYSWGGNTIQGNYIGTDVNGTLARGNTVGIHITESVNTIGGSASGQGNLISGNSGTGVWISGGAISNQVLGNKIGTDASGMNAIPNGTGIHIYTGSYNYIGDSSSGAGNLISGNDRNGILLAGYQGNQQITSGNQVLGNYIGTNVTGTGKLGNGGRGVLITRWASNNHIGGAQTGAGNLISDNGASGVEILGWFTEENYVLGNQIGVDSSGNVAMGNKVDGVRINNAAENVIGGTSSGAGNLISGNGQNGVYITGGQGRRTLLLGNKIGTNKAGTSKLGNGLNGVRIASAGGNYIGAATDGSGNLISGNKKTGVYISGNQNKVMRNTIGLDASGTYKLGNDGYGVFVYSGTWNTIGGNSSYARNLISGNKWAGVLLDALSNNSTVHGNYIGTNASGSSGVGNENNGIYIKNSQFNQIGSGASGQGNLISGNDGYGILIYGGVDNGTYYVAMNDVFGNTIGTNANRNLAVPNTYGGVKLILSDLNWIGGPGTGEGNLISGNGGDGLLLTNCWDNGVYGNKIGTNGSGDASLANQGNGVTLMSNSKGNYIGGSSSGTSNLISGNAWSGVQIDGNSTTDNSVFGNLIGVDASSSSPLGNGLNGVLISGGASDNLVGDSTTVGTGNTIAYNQRPGVLVINGTDNRILSNAIFSNLGLGIDLNNDDVTPNDTQDPDSGPNNLQNYPSLTAITDLGGGSTQINGSLNSLPSTSFKVQFFASTVCDYSGNGEGQRYLGETTVSTNTSGDATITAVVSSVVSSGEFVTATATDPNWNTSEFSACYPEPTFTFLPLVMKN